MDNTVIYRRLAAGLIWVAAPAPLWILIAMATFLF